MALIQHEQMASNIDNKQTSQSTVYGDFNHSAKSCMSYMSVTAEVEYVCFWIRSSKSVLSHSPDEASNNGSSVVLVILVVWKVALFD